ARRRRRLLPPPSRGDPARGALEARAPRSPGLALPAPVGARSGAAARPRIRVEALPTLRESVAHSAAARGAARAVPLREPRSRPARARRSVVRYQVHFLALRAASRRSVRPGSKCEKVNQVPYYGVAASPVARLRHARMHVSR